MFPLRKIIGKFFSFFVTNSERPTEISETRDISAPQNRDTASQKLVMESLSCPYCQSTRFVKKGFRTKIREKVQLYQCLSCRKVFTPRTTRGKHYRLAIMLDAISIYNLGYSLEATCRIVNLRHQKTASSAALVSSSSSLNGWIDTLERNIPQRSDFVKSENMSVDPPGVEPGRFGVSSQPSKPAEPTPISLSQITTKWVKVSLLKPNMEIATIDGWERIVSITPITREQVFDIEVEGTHNFVGNDIVAHNTFMNGNVGINRASPYGALNMAGNVYEWVADDFNAYPENDKYSQQDFNKGFKVFKGGAYTDGQSDQRPASRIGYQKDYKDVDIGFRCAKNE